MITSIVDYGAGNLLSVKNAVETCGFDAQIIDTPQQIDQAERLILPGVGAFSRAMQALTDRGFIEPLHRAALERKIPLLGICLGMQLMAKHSDELGGAAGLGWFDAHVVRIAPSDPLLKIPQIGWNAVEPRAGSPLFVGMPGTAVFYFVHSFHMQFGSDSPDLAATCDYAGPVTAAVRRDHLFGTQFHPEKSSSNGLRVLENFLNWNPPC